MIEVTDEMLKVARSMQSFELMIKRIIELHEANKPKPEPVAWVVWNGWNPVGVTLSEEKAKSYAQGRQLHSDLSGDFNAYRVAPLYTTPPTREPLSNNELLRIFEKCLALVWVITLHLPAQLNKPTE